MSLGDRLQQFLTMNRVSVRDFAARAGIPSRTLYDYLRGERKPGADHLAAMSKAGVDLEWLLTGEQAPRLTFDFKEYSSLRPISGVALADRELNALLIRLAIERVDAHLREHPDLMGKLGVIGVLASVWSLYSAFAAAAEAFSDQFEQARRDDWEVDRLAAMITTPMKGRDLALHSPG
jgi:transcriptional regulator with XRE-family HTH domain